jgi:hypothetical protein
MAINREKVPRARRWTSAAVKTGNGPLMAGMILRSHLAFAVSTGADSFGEISVGICLFMRKDAAQNGELHD